MTLIAETDRLVLRQLEMTDLDDLYRIYRSGDVRRFIEPMDDDYAVESAKLQSYIFYMYGFYGFGLFAVCLKENGRFIGRCGVWMSEINGHPEMEIGYMIEAEEQKKGYALESVMAVIDFVRRETDAERIVAKIHRENMASVKVALNAGFVSGVLQSGEADVDLYTYDVNRCNEE